MQSNGHDDPAGEGGRVIDSRSRLIYSILKQHLTAWQHDLAGQSKFQLGKKNT